MRKLNNKTLSTIHEGQVIKFQYQSGNTDIGVVKEVNLKAPAGIVIRCNAEKNMYFCISKITIDEGEMKFKILRKHAPIAQYGSFNEWDFVSNHQ